MTSYESTCDKKDFFKLFSFLESLSFLINFQFDISPMISPNPRNLNSSIYSRQTQIFRENSIVLHAAVKFYHLYQRTLYYCKTFNWICLLSEDQINIQNYLFSYFILSQQQSI